MKVQRITRAQGQYADKKQDIKDGDIVKILDEGMIVSGEYGDQHTFKIETRNGERLLNFNQTSLNNMVDAFGDETVSWVGKSVKIWLIRTMVSGGLKNVCYISHPEAVMNDDGRFVTPNRGDDIPVINEDINLKDIPF